MTPARLAPRLLGLWLASLMLAACATATQPAGPDHDTAARYSAELTAAQTYHEVTMRQAGDQRRAGTISEAAFARVFNAGKSLEVKTLVAHADLKLYLAGGPLPVAAYDGMRAAKANLELVWEAR